LAFRNAYWHIKDLVEKDLEPYFGDLDKLKRLHQLSSALLKRLKVLPITTNDSEESLSVFMTTNDRGLPLGVFDIVRGQVLRALTLDLPEQEKRHVFVETLSDWDEILRNVEGSKPDQFLRHYLLSERSEKITMKSLPKVTDKEINLTTSGYKERATNLWVGIRAASDVYNQILRPTIKGESKDRLHSLLLLADSYRLLLLRVLSPEAELTPSEQAELIRLTLIAVFKWIIANKNAQEFESELQKVAKPIWTVGGFKESKGIIEELIAGFELNNIEAFLADGVSVQTAKAIFFAIESELSGKADNLNYETIHLEHVAPQKSTSEWVEKLSGSEFSYQDLVSDIGNMTILDEGLNTKIKQAIFSIKKDSYNSSRSNMTNDLCGVAEWDPNLIVLRRKWISQSLSNILRIKPEPILHFTKWLSIQN
jgi:hypothetical protein